MQRDAGVTAIGSTRWTRTILRLEGLGVLVAASGTYAVTDGSWLLFAVLLLAPDLFMLGYLFGPAKGAVVYNLGHTYLWPLAFLAGGGLAGAPLLVDLGLIWAAHIGLDRMLGFGLKLPTGFRETHLGP